MSEIFVCFADDGVVGTTIPTYPPESTPVDYFSIRSNLSNPHFVFSSGGNFYCGKNINCNGKLILLEPNGDQIQITSNNNNWLFELLSK